MFGARLCGRRVDITKKTGRSASGVPGTQESTLGDIRVRYFLAVCEYGSFSLAAQACNVSQPSISTAVRRLENAVGGRLFERRHPVRLTPLGAQLRPMLEEMEALTARVTAFLDERRSISIGAASAPTPRNWNAKSRPSMTDAAVEASSRETSTPEG